VKRGAGRPVQHSRYVVASMASNRCEFAGDAEFRLGNREISFVIHGVVLLAGLPRPTVADK
jgi:hypothetical protein